MTAPSITTAQAPQFSTEDIAASSIREDMTVLVPGTGYVNIAHVFTDHGEVFVTNNMHDDEITVPLAIFPSHLSVKMLISDI